MTARKQRLVNPAAEHQNFSRMVESKRLFPYDNAAISIDNDNRRFAFGLGCSGMLCADQGAQNVPSLNGPLAKAVKKPGIEGDKATHHFSIPALSRQRRHCLWRFFASQPIHFTTHTNVVVL
jgi:hypothetical protein